MKPKITILIIAILFSAVVFPASADLNDGLISAWTFDDGKANDLINKNNGKITKAKVVDGKFLKGLEFNGKDSFVNVPHHKSMESIEKGLSVSAWVNIKEFVQPNHAGIVVKGNSIGWNQNYAFRIATRNVNQLTWAVPKQGAEGNFNTADVAKVDEWTFVCLTADGKDIKAYVGTNGKNLKEVGTKPQAAPYQPRAGEPVEIGVGRARGGTKGNDIFFKGIIDEVYLWGGRALSEDEIKKLADGDRPTNVVMSVNHLDKLSTIWAKLKK